MAAKRKPPPTVRVLPRAEWPAAVTAPRGAYTPRVEFVAQHPRGMYHVEIQGAGHRAAYFTPRRGTHKRPIGGASTLAGALERIAEHEGDLAEPSAPRETGAAGPASIYAVGRRTTPKTPTELDREIALFLAGARED